ncbi:MAG: hypothetical protein ABI723_11235 [Bacteroidia bacterium]
MGLDISIAINNHEEIFSDDYYGEENDYFNKHRLSRTFCNFICRQNVVVSHEPELDQIGQITGVDISPFYEMESYPENDGMEFFLATAETEDERQNILSQAEAGKDKLKGNIDKVLVTVTNLIDKLSAIDNLPGLLIKTDLDTLENEVYFSEFNIDKGQGYINNNFGQDLRNFKRFLEFAKDKGTTTAWFNYG